MSKLNLQEEVLSDGSLSIGDDSAASGVYMKEHVPLSYFAKYVNVLDDDEKDIIVKDDN